MNAIQELLKDFPKLTFKNEEEIKAFMNNHPDLFKWYFQEKGGFHSENLIQSDLSNTYTTELKLTDMVPGTKIRLVFSQSGAFESANHKDIVIGATGNYFADGLVPVYGVYLIKDPNNTTEFPISTSGAVSYQYKAPVRTSFNSINNIKTSVGEYKQFVGEIKDLVEDLTTARDSVTKICTSRYFKRPVEYLYYEGNNFNYVENAYLSSYDNEGYKVLVPEYKDKLYWNLDDYKWENNAVKFLNVFNEKKHLGYSPFSIYVLRNTMLYNGDQIEDLRNHLFKKFAKPGISDAEAHHRVDHMFEKYYIDRYLHAQSAEDMLIEYMSICARIDEGGEPEEIAAWEAVLNDTPLYVFDPWIGKVYKIGCYYPQEDLSNILDWVENSTYKKGDRIKYNNKYYRSLKDNNNTIPNGTDWEITNARYYYNSSIIYNNEQIDLKEIQRYDLNNLEPEDSSIFIGNGVYGDTLYQNVTTLYGFEESEEEIYEVNDKNVKINLGSLKASKDKYEAKFNKLRIHKWPIEYSEQDPTPLTMEVTRQEINNLDELYYNYNHLLSLSIERWISRESDIEQQLNQEE